MAKKIRIGTRDSELALWQAHEVKRLLDARGVDSEIVPIKSVGDIILDKPLYELGITGVFTKTLDVAMITGNIDIAVHSMKDVPTTLPHGIVQAAVIDRASVNDILVYTEQPDLKSEIVIATGSLRRQAQWLNRYPHHKVTDIRGNVNARLRKLKENQWGGAVFAEAGLDRINLKPDNHIVLDWMVPAPAQGAVMVVAMAGDSYSLEVLSGLNHFPTEMCTRVERDFLKTLEGGCTAPIGARATVVDDKIRMEGVLCSLDGQERLHVERVADVTHYKLLGIECATDILANGGTELMAQIRKDLKK